MTLNKLLSVYIFVICLSFVIKLPEKDFFMYYTLVTDKMFTLAFASMIISLVEIVWCSAINLIKYKMNHQTAMEIAVKSYCTQAEKEIDNESSKLKELFDMQSDILKLLKRDVYIDEETIDISCSPIPHLQDNQRK